MAQAQGGSTTPVHLTNRFGVPLEPSQIGAGESPAEPLQQEMTVHTVLDGEGNPVQVVEENLTTGARTVTNFTYEVEA